MKKLQAKLQFRFDEMCKTGILFVSDVSGRAVWDKYLSSFVTKEVFRDPESSTHNCNHCKNFVRRYGNILGVIDGELTSMWDITDVEAEYANSVNAVANLLKSAKISDVFFETFDELNSLLYESCNKKADKFRLGVAENGKVYTEEEIRKHDPEMKGNIKSGKGYTFNHIFLDLPKAFVSFTKDSQAKIQSDYRSKKDVFHRCMSEIPKDSLILMRDLIKQDSLLDSKKYITRTENGKEVKGIIESYIEFKEAFDKAEDKELFSWMTTFSMNDSFAKFGNSLQGEFLKAVSEGESLAKACGDYNKRIDPANYMKAKAPITPTQRKEAEQFVIENGYLESFSRRLATIDDIRASEILHINRTNKAKAVTIFDTLPKQKSRFKRSEFDKVETVTIAKFISEILPTASSVSVFFEGKHEGNLLNLTTTNDPDAKALFKWNNPFGYTFNGNLSGKSQLTQMVEAKGGRTDGVLRCTHSWNRLEPNQSLMDAHLFFPYNNHVTGIHDNYGVGRRIGWNARNDYASGGSQDVDYTAAAPVGYVPVENITLPNLNTLPEGVYKYKIHNWNYRSSGGKGECEIASECNIFQYEYPATKHKEWVDVAEITLHQDKRFSIKHILPLKSETSKDIWGLSTNDFHKVKVVSTSPNFWGEDVVGNKHYIFMLDGCKNPNSVRGFHNEHLNTELLSYRKVLDVLGDSAMIESSDNQIAGLGFNETVRDEVIVKVEGSFPRVLKIQF